jgi:outer membrane protein assembly factor BamB
VLFVGNLRGLIALSRDGKTLWTTPIDAVSGVPAIMPTGDVAVPTHGGELVIVSPRGERSRAFQVGATVVGSPLVLPDGSVVVSAIDAAMHRFDADGRRLFRAELLELGVDSASGRVTSPPASDGRHTLVAAAGAAVVLVSEQGNVRRRISLDGSAIGMPVVTKRGNIWLLTRGGGLYRFSSEGAEKLRIDLGVRVSAASGLAVAADGSVRVGALDAALLCIGPSGKERWRVTSEGAFPGMLTVDPTGVTLAINEQGRLYAVEPDGRVRWQQELGSYTPSAPVVGPDGVLYLVTPRGAVQAWQ